MRIALAALLVIGLVSPVGGQKLRGAIEGTVSDNVAGVPGAKVTLTPAGSQTGGITITTGPEGRFSFGNFPVGPYSIDVSVRGFLPDIADVVIEADRVTAVNFKLVPGPSKFDPVETYLIDFVGRPASMCGRAGLSNGPATVQRLEGMLRCALALSRTKTAFVSIVQRQGTDSQIFDGLLGRPDGTMFVFQFDSDPSGGSGAPARFVTSLCATPSVATMPGQSGEAHFVCGR